MSRKLPYVKVERLVINGNDKAGITNPTQKRMPPGASPKSTCEKRQASSTSATYVVLEQSGAKKPKVMVSAANKKALEQSDSKKAKKAAVPAPSKTSKQANSKRSKKKSAGAKKQKTPPMSSLNNKPNCNCQESGDSGQKNSCNLCTVGKPSEAECARPTYGMLTRVITRNTRSTRSRPNLFLAPRTSVPKGKSRRTICFKKKKPVKRSLTILATTYTRDFVIHQGRYIHVGDIVSMKDREGVSHYAQVRGLLQDIRENSAVITWLVPKPNKPVNETAFDPSFYTTGMSETLPRKLEYMEFVMPSRLDFFQPYLAPYSTRRYIPGSASTSVSYRKRAS